MEHSLNRPSVLPYAVYVSVSRPVSAARGDVLVEVGVVLASAVAGVTWGRWVSGVARGPGSSTFSFRDTVVVKARDVLDGGPFLFVSELDVKSYKWYGFL